MRKRHLGYVSFDNVANFRWDTRHVFVGAVGLKIKGGEGLCEYNEEKISGVRKVESIAYGRTNAVATVTCNLLIDLCPGHLANLNHTRG